MGTVRSVRRMMPYAGSHGEPGEGREGIDRLLPRAPVHPSGFGPGVRRVRKGGWGAIALLPSAECAVGLRAWPTAWGAAIRARPEDLGDGKGGTFVIPTPSPFVIPQESGFSGPLFTRKELELKKKLFWIFAIALFLGWRGLADARPGPPLPPPPPAPHSLPLPPVPPGLGDPEDLVPYFDDPGRGWYIEGYWSGGRPHRGRWIAPFWTNDILVFERHYRHYRGPHRSYFDIHLRSHVDRHHEWRRHRFDDRHDRRMDRREDRRDRRHDRMDDRRDRREDRRDRREDRRDDRRDRRKDRRDDRDRDRQDADHGKPDRERDGGKK